jgi:hypothetical protein
MINGIGISIGGTRRRFNPATFVGAKGAWADFSDSSRLWQDSAGTVPATGATDPVGLVQFQGPVQPVTAAQSSDALRPTRAAGGLAFNGTSQFMEFGANFRNILSDAPGVSLLLGFNLTSLTAVNTLVRISSNTATFTRFLLFVNTDGSLRLTCRRADGDIGTVLVGTPGSVVTGVDYVAEAYIDFANGGAGAIQTVLNGVTVETAALAGTGNTSATTSPRGRLGANLADTPALFQTGRLRSRFLFKNAWTAAADRASARAWVAAGS